MSESLRRIPFQGWFTYDPSCDMGYIYFTQAPIEVSQTLAADNDEVLFNLDIDANGALLGIEVFGQARMPEQLRSS